MQAPAPRKEIAKLIKELEPKVSNRAIAKAVGVGSRTIDRDVRQDGAKKSEKPKENSKGARHGSAAPTTGAAADKLAQKRAAGRGTLVMPLFSFCGIPCRAGAKLVGLSMVIEAKLGAAYDSHGRISNTSLDEETFLSTQNAVVDNNARFCVIARARVGVCPFSWESNQ
ncbi:MAG: hypothetical protein WBS22_17815 [Methylocystis sp.]